jgi:hypothetical protein
MFREDGGDDVAHAQSIGGAGRAVETLLRWHAWLLASRRPHDIGSHAAPARLRQQNNSLLPCGAHRRTGAHCGSGHESGAL